MHFENTKVKIWKKKHAYSFPIIATNGLHIGPNLSKLCHPLAREGDKKNRCQQHHLVFWFFSTWFGVKLFLYPKKLLLWVWVFKMLNSMHVVFYFFPCCPQLPILPKSPQRHQYSSVIRSVQTNRLHMGWQLRSQTSAQSVKKGSHLVLLLWLPQFGVIQRIYGIWRQQHIIVEICVIMCNLFQLGTSGTCSFPRVYIGIVERLWTPNHPTLTG